MTWFLVAIGAVILQTGRYTTAKILSNRVSDEAVTLCRFLYAIPVVGLVYFIARNLFGDVNIISSRFWIWVALYTLSQIVATTLLVRLFHHKNYAVTMMYAKSETIFVTLLALIFLAERLSVLGWLGVFLAFVGLVWAGLAKEQISPRLFLSSFTSHSSQLGLMAGFFFAVSAIGIKLSFLHIAADSIIMKAVFVLLVGVIIQTAILTPYIYVRYRADLITIIRQPKIPFLVGLFSATSSFLWFVGFALTYIAYVKTVGQLEFIASILVSTKYFKEEIHPREYAGMGVMVVGIVMLLFA